jgi:hypothetical protein
MWKGCLSVSSGLQGDRLPMPVWIAMDRRDSNLRGSRFLNFFWSVSKVSSPWFLGPARVFISRIFPDTTGVCVLITMPRFFRLGCSKGDFRSDFPVIECLKILIICYLVKDTVLASYQSLCTNYRTSDSFSSQQLSCSYFWSDYY